MEKNTEKIKVILADDHVLLRNALGAMVDKFEECRVIHQCGNGKEVIEVIKQGVHPDVIILDLNMPEMDGFEAASWLYKYRPDINILVLTMYDSELSMIRLLGSGVKGFLKKDIHPSELKRAIHSIVQSGFYFTNHNSQKLAHLFHTNTEGSMKLAQLMLTTHEFEFLKLACSDLTYKEIALKMGLPTRSIDTLRDNLFIKLDVESRVGLAMVAMSNGIVSF
ncbi:MAG: response regulator transcription factor [Chitinophagaceae bacterium]